MKKTLTRQKIEAEVMHIFQKIISSDGTPTTEIQNIDKRCFLSIIFSKDVDIGHMKSTNHYIGGNRFEKLMKLAKKHNLELNNITSRIWSYHHTDEKQNSLVLKTKILLVEK
jgi:hypothetical protein